jgi:hypothetical protein
MLFEELEKIKKMWYLIGYAAALIESEKYHKENRNAQTAKKLYRKTRFIRTCLAFA